MKFKLIFTSLLLAMSANSFALEAKLADTKWDGVKVPEGQQCQKFNGKDPATPTIALSKIPEGTNLIVLEYSDRDSEKMNNGGHGRMSFAIDASATEVEVPSILGHTFEIPKEFKVIEAHRSPKWDKAGAYMPPCSGGKDHAYYVTIKTMAGDKVTATTTLEMGNY